MKSTQLLTITLFLTSTTIAQRVGIGTNKPLALLHVNDSSVLFSGLDYLKGNPTKPPISGKGSRTFWYAEKAAFRTGAVYNGALFGIGDADESNFNNWDKDSIGVVSFAAGFNTKAKGDFSFAMGHQSFSYGNSATSFGSNNVARGNFSTAFGSNNNAIGSASTAIGNGNVASGTFSLAAGEFTNATGVVSTTMGSNTTASGKFSTALGFMTTASGNYSTSMGDNTIAGGDFSTAMGEYTTASGDYSTAIGKSTKATGYNSFAVGGTTSASGSGAVAIGENTIASGDNSTAMGINASTNLHKNSFCIAGVPQVASTFNTLDNQMMMRFDNYTFWVSSANYAYLIPASNGWAYTSDKNKKENFQELNGEAVLKKIAKIPLTSWNFKANDTKQYRHYGIMAQDFFAAFGKDDYGVIGNDTTVSPLDLLGVAYSAIKALEKRTEATQLQSLQLTETLQTQNQQLLVQNKLLEKEIAQLKELIDLKNRLTNSK